MTRLALLVYLFGISFVRHILHFFIVCVLWDSTLGLIQGANGGMAWDDGVAIDPIKQQRIYGFDMWANMTEGL